MKKDVEVKIEIDTDECGVSQVESTTDGSKFLIKIRKEQGLEEHGFDPNKVISVISLAHELGHMLAKIYGDPTDKADPRSHKVSRALFDSFPSSDSAMAVLANEEKAWDYGEKIMEAFAEHKDVALKTYENMIQRVKERENSDPELSEKRRILQSLLDIFKS